MHHCKQNNHYDQYLIRLYAMIIDLGFPRTPSFFLSTLDDAVSTVELLLSQENCG